MPQALDHAIGESCRNLGSSVGPWAMTRQVAHLLVQEDEVVDQHGSKTSPIVVRPLS